MLHPQAGLSGVFHCQTADCCSEGGGDASNHPSAIKTKLTIPVSAELTPLHQERNLYLQFSLPSVDVIRGLI